MQGPWEAMLTFSEGAKLKGARQNLRMQGYPSESCSSLLCGLAVGAGTAEAGAGAGWEAESEKRGRGREGAWAPDSSR